MLLYLVLIGLASYKIVQVLQSLSPLIDTAPPWIKHLLVLGACAAFVRYTHIEEPVLATFAAAALASGWHSLVRFVYIAATMMRGTPRKR